MHQWFQILKTCCLQCHMEMSDQARGDKFNDVIDFCMRRHSSAIYWPKTHERRCSCDIHRNVRSQKCKRQTRIPVCHNIRHTLPHTYSVSNIIGKRIDATVEQSTFCYHHGTMWFWISRTIHIWPAVGNRILCYSISVTRQRTYCDVHV